MNKKKYITMFCLLVLTIMISSANFAFAASAQGMDQFESFATAIRWVALPLGAAGVAFCGIKYLTGDAQSSAKALRTALVILFAVAAAFMLPVFLKMGAGTGAMWSPPGAG